MKKKKYILGLGHCVSASGKLRKEMFNQICTKVENEPHYLWPATEKLQKRTAATHTVFLCFSPRFSKQLQMYLLDF